MTLNYGAKVSKPGQSVETATDVQSTFSSKFSTLKILSQADVTVTTDGSGNATQTIAHNLGYAPAHYVWLKGTAQNTLLDASSYANSFVPITPAGSQWISAANKIDAYADSTNLVITITGASATTAYNFRYYLFVDLAQAYSGAAGISLSSGYGLKVSKTGFNVTDGKEYNMVYSQKYKSLQYYDESYKTQDLTLPELNSTLNDTPQNSGTYVDFNHGLGYQPFFFVYAYNVSFVGATPGYNVFVPVYVDKGNLAAGYGGFLSIDAFCDTTKIRVSFIQQSTTPNSNGDGNGYPFDATTVTIKCFVFTENLTA